MNGQRGERIEKLKEQSKRMALTLNNLNEAFQSLCDITKELAVELNKIQIEMDAQETYRMEQMERE